MRRVTSALATGLVFCALGSGVSFAEVSAPTPTVTVQPVNIATYAYESLALYDPVTAKARLYAADRLVPQTSPELSWTAGVTPVTVSIPVQPGVYDVSWSDGAAVAPLIVSSSPSVRNSRVMVLIPDYTVQAYSDTGGGSFYVSNVPVRTDRKVSMERPYHFTARGQAPGPGFANPFALYASTIDYLRESLGAVDVAAQSLVDVLPYNLNAYSLIVLMGHDEYWTSNLRAKLEGAVANGSSLLNMSGNTGYRKLVRTGSVLGAEPEGTIWGSNPLDTTVAELTGVKYMRYPLAVELARTRSKVRTVLYARYRRHGFPRWVPQRKFLRYTSGMHSRRGANPLFEGTTLGVGRFFGVTSKALDIEVDGLPLTGRGKPNGSWPSANDPTRTSVSADAWVDNRGDRVGVIVQHLYGRGRVVTIGSVGWIAALDRGDGDVQLITRNAANLLLTAMGPALQGYQWVDAPSMDDGSAILGFLSVPRGARIDVSVTCTLQGDPTTSVWCAAHPLANGELHLRVPSRRAVDAHVSLAVTPSPNFILAMTPSYVTKNLQVAGG